MGTIRKEVKEFYISQYPDDEDILKPFLAGFHVTWARQRKEYNTDLRVFFLNPEPFMKETYGFENEILLIYSPYVRMEPRTIQAVEQIFSQSPAKGRVETLNYFLISDAPDVNEWLHTYTSSRQESRIVVAFTKHELIKNTFDPWYIRNKLNQQFFGRDLFNYTLPLVEDTYLFGRQPIIMEYYDSIKRSENKAIFGLRKTGKTSFLFKLKRLLETEEIARVYYYDCKKPDIRKCRWNELLEEISSQIAKDFKINTKYDFDERKASKSFYTLISEINRRNKKICLMFDEIEYISFIAKRDIHWHEDYLDFWQTVWSCQSELKSLSFILAGVNPSIVETDLVNGVQNPLFGIVPYKFLTGLELEEVRIMLKTLGKRMGLIFDYKVIGDIADWYGRHPLLIRLACSYLNTVLSRIVEKPITITPSTFTTVKSKCDQELLFYCNHVISELREFYPDQYFMLELLASGQTLDFKELSEDHTYTRHLKNYGILVDHKGQIQFAIPVIGQFIGSELRKKEERSLIYKIIPFEDREEWLTRRKESIVNDFRMLERLIQKNNLQQLFGVNSFPEADEFMKLIVCSTKQSFSDFINTCSRCFVESIESYGRSIKNKTYFWDIIKRDYPCLFNSLHRIKIYRNERDHLELNNQVNQVLLEFLKEDLEGKNHHN